MAKAKYKLGTLIEKNGGKIGTVDAIITATDGYLYALKGEPIGDAVPEGEVINAFKPIVPREKKAGGSPRKKSKSKQAEAVQ